MGEGDVEWGVGDATGAPPGGGAGFRTVEARSPRLREEGGGSLGVRGWGRSTRV